MAEKAIDADARRSELGDEAGLCEIASLTDRGEYLVRRAVGVEILADLALLDAIPGPFGLGISLSEESPFRVLFLVAHLAPRDELGLAENVLPDEIPL